MTGIIPLQSPASPFPSPSAAEVERFNRLKNLLLPEAANQSELVNELSRRIDWVSGNLTMAAVELRALAAQLDPSSNSTTPGLVPERLALSQAAHTFAANLLAAQRKAYNLLLATFKAALNSKSSAEISMSAALVAAAVDTARLANGNVSSVGQLAQSTVNKVLGVFSSFDSDALLTQSTAAKLVNKSSLIFKAEADKLLGSLNMSANALNAISDSVGDAQETVQAVSDKISASTGSDSNAALSGVLTGVQGLAKTASANQDAMLQAASSSVAVAIGALGSEAVKNLTQSESNFTSTLKSLSGEADETVKGFNRSISALAITGSKNISDVDSAGTRLLSSNLNSISSSAQLSTTTQTKLAELNDQYQNGLISLSSLKAKKLEILKSESASFVGSQPWGDSAGEIAQKTGGMANDLQNQQVNAQGKLLLTGSQTSNRVGEQNMEISSESSKVSSAMKSAGALNSASVGQWVDSQSMALGGMTMTVKQSLSDLQKGAKRATFDAQQSDDNFANSFKRNELNSRGSMSHALVDLNDITRLSYNGLKDQTDEEFQNQNLAIKNPLNRIRSIQRGDPRDSVDAGISALSLAHEVRVHKSKKLRKNVGEFSAKTSQDLAGLGVINTIPDNDKYISDTGRELDAMVYGLGDSGDALQATIDNEKAMGSILIENARNGVNDEISGIIDFGDQIDQSANDLRSHMRDDISLYDTQSQNSINTLSQTVDRKLNMFTATQSGNAAGLVSDLGTKNSAKAAGIKTGIDQAGSLIDILQKNLTTAKQMSSNFQVQANSLSTKIDAITSNANDFVNGQISNLNATLSTTLEGVKEIGVANSESIESARAALKEGEELRDKIIYSKLDLLDKFLISARKKVDGFVSQIKAAIDGATGDMAEKVNVSNAQVATALEALAASADEAYSSVQSADKSMSSKRIGAPISSSNEAVRQAASAIAAASQSAQAQSSQLGLLTANQIDSMTDKVQSFLGSFNNSTRSAKSNLDSGISQYQSLLINGNRGLVSGLGDVLEQISSAQQSASNRLNDQGNESSELLNKSGVVANLSGAQLAALVDAVASTSEAKLDAAAQNSKISLSRVADLTTSMAIFTNLVESVIAESTGSIQLLADEEDGLAEDVEDAMDFLEGYVGNRSSEISGNSTMMNTQIKNFFPPIRIQQSGIAERLMSSQNDLSSQVASIQVDIQKANADWEQAKRKRGQGRAFQLQRLTAFATQQEGNFAEALTSLTR